MTERDKMLAGELYNALDPDLVAARERARDLCQALNQTRESERELRRSLLRDLFDHIRVLSSIPIQAFWAERLSSNGAPNHVGRILRDFLLIKRIPYELAP
jgi:glucose-6-phosphate-specific signal transduction histidine kinase